MLSDPTAVQAVDDVHDTLVRPQNFETGPAFATVVQRLPFQCTMSPLPCAVFGSDVEMKSYDPTAVQLTGLTHEIEVRVAWTAMPAGVAP